MVMTRMVQMSNKMGNKRSMEEDYNAWWSAVLVEEDMVHLLACIECLQMLGDCMAFLSPVCDVSWYMPKVWVPVALMSWIVAGVVVWLVVLVWPCRSQADAMSLPNLVLLACGYRALYQGGGPSGVWMRNRLECVSNAGTRGVSGLYRSSLLSLQ
jgi:hypothetical protein